MPHSQFNGLHRERKAFASSSGPIFATENFSSGLRNPIIFMLG
jgi:hypothetical protein